MWRQRGQRAEATRLQLTEIMASSREDGNHTVANQEYSCSMGLEETHKMIISILGIPLFISAVLGNILIIVAFRKVSSLHPPSKLLLSRLSCTDLVMNFICHPLFAAISFSPEKSVVCYTLWILYTIVAFAFRGASLSTTTAISVDRLLALLLGLRYRQVGTVRRVKFLTFFLWLLSASAAIVTFYGPRLASRIAFAAGLCCAITSSFCYIKIYYKLRLSQAQVQDQCHERQPNQEGIQMKRVRYKKTVSTALWVQVLFLACHLPFGLLLGFITITGLNTPFLWFALALATDLMCIYSTLNPLLYCWRMRELRQAVKDTIKKFCCLSQREAT